MRRLIPILAAALAGSALTAAAITLPARATGSEDRFDERLRQWEQCMREAGFELGGDTTIRVTPDGVIVDGEEVDPERFREAGRDCGRPFALPRPRLEDLPELEGLPDAVPPRLRDGLERLGDCLAPGDI